MTLPTKKDLPEIIKGIEVILEPEMYERITNNKVPEELLLLALAKQNIPELLNIWDKKKMMHNSEGVIKFFVELIRDGEIEVDPEFRKRVLEKYARIEVSVEAKRLTKDLKHLQIGDSNLSEIISLMEYSEIQEISKAIERHLEKKDEAHRKRTKQEIEILFKKIIENVAQRIRAKRYTEKLARSRKTFGDNIGEHRKRDLEFMLDGELLRKGRTDLVRPKYRPKIK